VAGVLGTLPDPFGEGLRGPSYPGDVFVPVAVAVGHGQSPSVVYHFSRDCQGIEVRCGQPQMVYEQQRSIEKGFGMGTPLNPLDLVHPGASLTINPDGSVELSVIDYGAETGPFFYVEVDGTPVCPDRPLPLEHAIAKFRREVADAQAEYPVGIRQCEVEDLEWAGVTPANPGEDDDA
jgi:hypothetical protein